MFSFERPENYKYFIARRNWDDAYPEYEYLYYDSEKSSVIWSKEKSQHFDYHSSRVIAGLVKRSEVENDNCEYGLIPNDIFLNLD